MQVRRPNDQRLNTYDGPSTIRRSNRNIIVHPMPASGGGYRVRFFECETTCSFSQSPGVRQWGPGNFYPIVTHNGDWQWFVSEGKCLSVDANKYFIHCSIFNNTISASFNDSVEGMTNPCDNIYWISRAELKLEIQDHLGRAISIPQSVFYGYVDGAGAGGTTEACNTNYTFYTTSYVTDNKKSYPTKYRWVANLSGNASIDLSGTLLVQYLYYGV